MQNRKQLEQRTKQVVKNMFYRNTFDVTLLDRYFEEHKTLDSSFIYSLHSYISKHFGTDTFIFTDVFDDAFRKMIVKFLLHYPTLNPNYFKYTIDVNKENPVVFQNEFTQKMFNIWIRKES